MLTYSWKSNSIELNSNQIENQNAFAKLIDEERSTKVIYNLEIFNTTKENAGTYRCTLANEYGYDDISYELEVQLAPKIENISVSNVTHTSIEYVFEGSSMYIVCETDGLPIPAFKWKKNGVAIVNDSRMLEY